MAHASNLLLQHLYDSGIFFFCVCACVCVFFFSFFDFNDENKNFQKLSQLKGRKKMPNNFALLRNTTSSSSKACSQ
jgi:hypothetical protein